MFSVENHHGHIDERPQNILVEEKEAGLVTSRMHSLRRVEDSIDVVVCKPHVWTELDNARQEVLVMLVKTTRRYVRGNWSYPRGT